MSLHLIPADPVGDGPAQHLSRGLGASVAVFVSLLAGMATEALSQDTLPAAQEPKVLVWRQVRNDFFNPNVPSDVVSQIVERTPPTLLTIAPGDTVSAQLQCQLYTHSEDVRGTDSQDSGPERESESRQGCRRYDAARPANSKSGVARLRNSVSEPPRLCRRPPCVSQAGIADSDCC